jgi:hypothetical protein
MADLIEYFLLSTRTVDKDVEKHHLTSRKSSANAGFNKLPVQQAKYNLRKINDLPIHDFRVCGVFLQKPACRE